MPLYEYECQACGHFFERIQKYADSPMEECPKCGKKKLHKLVSSPAIKFKGSGFYINDYAKKGTAGAEKSSSKDEKTAPADSSKSAAASSSTDAAPASSSSKDS